MWGLKEVARTSDGNNMIIEIYLFDFLHGARNVLFGLLADSQIFYLPLKSNPSSVLIQTSTNSDFPNPH